jgi:hypothetical protein
MTKSQIPHNGKCEKINETTWIPITKKSKIITWALTTQSIMGFDNLKMQPPPSSKLNNSMRNYMMLLKHSKKRWR